MSATAHAKCLPTENSCNCFIAQNGDKIYINPEAVVLYESKIYLNVDNNPILVSALFSDAGGLYISKKKEEKEKKEGTWTCPTCGWTNPLTSPICEKSGQHFIYESNRR